MEWLSFCWQIHHQLYYNLTCIGMVAWSDARPPGMRMVSGSILASGKHSFMEIWSWKHFYSYSLPSADLSRPGSCQLLAKECALSTGKLPRRLAQEQCG